MKFKVFIFTFIMLFSSVFTYGDAFYMEAKNELLGIKTIEHHHINGKSHEKEEHQEENHSKDCEDECHFCLISGVSNTFFLEITQFKIPLIIEEATQNTYYYLLLNNENYLDGIWQPPKFIS